jgi:hypothetical protein
MNIEVNNGDILYNGEHIGNIKGNHAFLKRSVAPNVKGAIKTAAKNPGLKFSTEAQTEEPPKDLGGPVKVKAPAADAVKIEEPIHLQHPAMGDKTPAFVDWCRTNLPPEDFQRRYGHRRIPADMREFEDGERKRHAPLKDEKSDGGN